MTYFDINNKRYFTFDSESTMATYEYQGFGYLDQGALKQTKGTCDIKFKNYKEFVKFCRAITRQENDGNIEKVYMTRGGNCVVKKYKD